jgi:VanZ family protein
LRMYKPFRDLRKRTYQKQYHNLKQISAPSMTNAFLRSTLSVAALTLVAAVLYYGIVFDAPLPDYRWLHGKNDLALHALAFFALSLPTLALWPRLMSVIGLAGLAAAVEVAQFWVLGRNPGIDDILAGLAGIALGMAIIWGLHRLFRHRLDRLNGHGAKSDTT